MSSPSNIPPQQSPPQQSDATLLLANQSQSDSSSVLSSPAPTPSIYAYGDKIGSLHLHPCDLETYLTIDRSVYGIYELVDNVLIAHDMANHHHQKEVHAVLNGFTENVRAGRVPNDMHAFASPLVAVPSPQNTSASQQTSHGSHSSSTVPSSSSSALRKEKKYSVLVPDFAVGDALSTEARAALSPRSQQLKFPLGSTLHTVVESTSHNRERDLKEKPVL